MSWSADKARLEAGNHGRILSVLARRPPLSVAAVLVVTAITTVWDLWGWLDNVLHRPFTNVDFVAYYSAALVGRDQGWSRIYDFRLQAQAAASFGAPFLDFINPPPLAWLVAPFSLLPFRAAYAVWVALLLAALLVAWWLAAPRDPFKRAATLTAALGLFAVAFALQLGQAAVIDAVALVFAWRLLRSGREIPAGLLLGVAIALKPQPLWLVPVALLAAGHRRAFGAALLAVVLLIGASIAILGRDGTSAALTAVAYYENAPLHRHFALAGTLGRTLFTTALQVAFAGLAVVAARRRRASLEDVLAAGAVGSLLLSPHVTYQDFTVLVLAAWLVLRRRAPWPLQLLFVLGWLAVELALVVGPLPVLVAEVLWLGWLLLAASFENHEHGRAEQDDPERREDAADHRQHHLE